MSVIDTTNYNNIFFKKNVINLKKFIQYNIYYFYFTKTRITLIFSYNNNSDSIDQTYRNAIWLEREISELYGVNFFLKKDARSLLLDYSRNEHPFLKDFPCEGYYEIYFDFFENKLNYSKNEFIEL